MRLTDSARFSGSFRENHIDFIEPGEYFVSMEGDPSETGTYSLRLVRESPDPTPPEEPSEFLNVVCRLLEDGLYAGDYDVDQNGQLTGADVDAFLASVNSRQGDANLDGRVDFTDFLILSNNFGSSNRGWSGGDFDCDGSVGFRDFLVVSNNFGLGL